MGATWEEWLLGLGMWSVLVLYGFWLSWCEGRAERRRSVAVGECDTISA